MRRATAPPPRRGGRRPRLDGWYGRQVPALIGGPPVLVAILLLTHVNGAHPNWPLFWGLCAAAAVIWIVASEGWRRRASSRRTHITEVFRADEPVSRDGHMYVARCDADGWFTTAATREEAVRAARGHAPGVKPSSGPQGAAPSSTM